VLTQSDGQLLIGNIFGSTALGLSEHRTKLRVAGREFSRIDQARVDELQAKSLERAQLSTTKRSDTGSGDIIKDVLGALGGNVKEQASK